jgi:predicted NBD/HSP70 family sugar kinase
MSRLPFPPAGGAARPSTTVVGPWAAAADQSSVRRANLGVVLRCVADNGRCSRADVAGRTGLTRGTVSSLVTELIALDLLRESDLPAEPRRIGRPGVALQLANRIVGVGLEVNVDYLAVHVEDLAGTVRFQHRVDRDNRGSKPRPVLDHVAHLAKGALDDVAAQGLHAAGIALAVPGPVELQTGTLVFAPNLGWSDVPLREELGARLDRAVEIENEANLAALAEHWGGAARGFEDFILAFGEIGVGGGIVVGGKLYRGVNGFGGELGHVPVEQGGLTCACGSAGCLETRAGVEAIARVAGVPSSNRRRNRVGAELVQRAADGDAAVIAACAEAGRWLGLGLAAAVNLLGLDAVVLGGCYGPLAPWIAHDVEAAVRERSLAARSAPIHVLRSTFGPDAAMRGAAAVSLRRVLDDPTSLVGDTLLRDVI